MDTISDNTSDVRPMRAWWVGDYLVYAARTAEDALRAAHEDWDGDCGETLDEVHEVGADAAMTMGTEDDPGRGPKANIRDVAAKMTTPGFVCGRDS